MTETKQNLRTRFLAIRDSIPEAQRIERALAIADIGFEALADRLTGLVVAGYHPIRSELDPRPLMSRLATRNARLALPVVLPEGRLAFRELVRSAELVPGAFGTAHPGADAEALDPDALLMPLSVFDPAGGRIGYGAGYYDRAIAGLKASGGKPLLIGLAFDEQRATDVPQDAHDQRLDFILTPSGITEIQP